MANVNPVFEYEEIKQIVAQRVANAIKAIAIYESINQTKQRENKVAGNASNKRKRRLHDFETASQAFQTSSPHSNLDSSISLQAKLSSCLVPFKIESKSRVFPPNVFQSIPSEDPYEEAVRQLLEQAPRPSEYVPDPMELEDHVLVYIPEPEHPEDLVPAEDEAPIEAYIT
ncbi:hypothetical protein Tco_0289887 [Tanacetum coccineum]